MRTRKHPSGRILGFQDRFVPRVRSGDKRHTIRAGQFWRPGMIAHLYEKSRQPGMTLIFRAEVTKVEEIQFTAGRHGRMPMDVWIEGIALNRSECEALALTDGFQGFQEMVEFWRDRLAKNDGDWYGQVIHWNYEARFLSKPQPNKAARSGRKKLTI